MKQLCENMLVPSSSNWLDLLRASNVVHSQRLQLHVLTYLRDHFSALQGLFANSDSVAELSKLMQSIDGKDGDEASALPAGGAATATSTADATTSSSSKGAASSDKSKVSFADKTGGTDDDGDLEEEEAYDLKQLKSEFPELLDRLLQMRSILSPAPPSVVLNQQRAVNMSESVKRATKLPTFPKLALLMALVSLYFYQYFSNMISIGPMVPFINSVAVVGVIGYIIVNLNNMN